MTKRIGLNTLGMITLIVIYSISAILFTLISSKDNSMIFSPVSIGTLGWKFLFGLLILIAYIIVGYMHSIEPLLKKPFVITYWIFFAIFAYLFIIVVLLPSTSVETHVFSSFPYYSINYFGWYQGYFISINLDIAYGFNGFAWLQIVGLLNLALGCSIWRVKI